MSDTLQLILEKLNTIEARQKAIQLEQKYLYRQMEALFSLYHQIDFSAHLLNMRSWVASPDLLAILSALILDHQPKVVFEAGGGKTTVISAYSLKKLGAGHVYAVDHIEKFADITREEIERHGLSDYATVIYAPLVAHEIDGEPWLWYDRDTFSMVDNIDLLVVDGPPQYDNPQSLARYPALPLLRDKVTPDCLMLMDDADREDETQVMTRWEAEFPIEVLRWYEKSWGDVEKGAKLFRLKG